MPLSNKPAATKMQVGETAYWLSGGEIKSALIEKITVEVSDPAGNGTALQINTYKLAGTADNVPESKIFHSRNALPYSVKGTYLNSWANADFSTLPVIGATNDYSYSSFATAVFNDDANGVNFNEAVLDGCNFTNANLAHCNVSNCSMKYAVLTGATLTDANFAGANLTGATMPTNADTKSEFKALVGSYTGCEWVDGSTVT